MYVSLGTAYTDRADVYGLCIAELCRDYRLVISTEKVDPDAFGALPVGQPSRAPNRNSTCWATRTSSSPMPGWASESLWFGVPTVAVSQAVDQFLNADTLAQIGAGVHLPDDELTGPALRSAVEAALGCTRRARELRDEVRRQCGTEGAADAVEHLVSAPG